MPLPAGRVPGPARVCILRLRIGDPLALVPRVEAVVQAGCGLVTLTLDSMRELSVAKQRYQAVLAVVADGLSVSQVGSKVGVSRQTVHAWLARYEAEGLEGLKDRSHRPAGCRIRCQRRLRRWCWSCGAPARIGALRSQAW